MGAPHSSSLSTAQVSLCKALSSCLHQKSLVVFKKISFTWEIMCAKVVGWGLMISLVRWSGATGCFICTFESQSKFSEVKKWSLKWRYFLLLHNSDFVISLYIWTIVCGVSVPCGFHGYVSSEASSKYVYMHNNPPLLFQIVAILQYLDLVLGHLHVKTLQHNVNSVHCNKGSKGHRKSVPP